MKKNLLALPLALLVLATTQQACYGKFNLTRKVYEINGKVTDNKFVHSLVMWVFVIVPVYGLAAFADVVVLNVIEFWTGENPMKASATVGEDGTTLTINPSMKNGTDTLVITRTAGEVVLNRVEITKVDSGMMQAVSLRADGSVESTEFFPMNEATARQFAMAAH